MSFEKIINTAYSFGAAIVVFGAWSKIENLESGNMALTVGLMVEMCIFFIYGLMEWRKNPPEQKINPQTGEQDEVRELTGTMEQTNRILKKIFHTE